MSEEMIIVTHDAVPRTFTREETTTFERQKDTVVFEHETVVRVFSEVIPNGA